MFTSRRTNDVSGPDQAIYAQHFKNISGDPNIDSFDTTQITCLMAKKHVINPLNFGGTTFGVPTHVVTGSVYKSFGQGVRMQYRRKTTTEKIKSVYLGFIVDRVGDIGDINFGYEIETKYRDA